MTSETLSIQEMEEQYLSGDFKSIVYTSEQAARIWSMAANLDVGKELSKKYGGLTLPRFSNDGLTYEEIKEAGEKATIGLGYIEAATDRVFEEELSEYVKDALKKGSQSIGFVWSMSQSLVLAGLGVFFPEYIREIGETIATFGFIGVGMGTYYGISNLSERCFIHLALNNRRKSLNSELERKLVGGIGLD